MNLAIDVGDLHDVSSKNDGCLFSKPCSTGRREHTVTMVQFSGEDQGAVDTLRSTEASMSIKNEI